MSYAARYVPYYQDTLRRIGLRADDIRTAADLARLPLIERRQLQRDPEYFVSTRTPLRRLVELRSGGSTGAPCSVYHDAAALFQNAAQSERDRSIRTRLLGRWTGYRQTLIASSFSGIQKVQAFLDAHAVFPRRARLERQYLSLLDPPEENLARINAFRPDVLHAYGSYVARLYAHAYETGTPFHRPRVVTYGGDGLSPAGRALIEQELGIPVFAIYQSIEALRIGFECEAHSGLHLNADLYPVRVVDPDGRTLPEGTSGEVVVSNLVNRGTVLLNYRLGDIAAALPGPCPCGRTLPRLSPPPGRMDDMIELESGALLHPQGIRDLFTDERELWQYQVIQETPTRLRVDVVAAQECDRSATTVRLARKFAERFGARMTTEIRFVDRVSRTAQGKARAVLSMHAERGLGSAAER